MIYQSCKHYLEQKIGPLKVLNQLVNAVKIKTNESNEAVSLFKDRCSKASELFQYFNIFLESITLVLRDLTCLAVIQTFSMTYSAFLEGDFTVKHISNRGSGVPLDQVLETQYKKSVKGPSRITGYTRRKEGVLKWNIIHREKRQFTDFLYNTSCIDDESEYSLHHKILYTKTEADEICVSQLETYISQ